MSINLRDLILFQICIALLFNLISVVDVEEVDGMNLLPTFTFLCLLKYIKVTRNMKILPGDDMEEKPPGRPLIVNTSLNLRNIIEVSEVEQTITLEITLSMYWRDDRLNLTSSAWLSRDPSHYNLSYKVQTREQIDNIWIPDMFLDEAIAVRNSTYKVATEYLRLYEDSSLKFSKRFNFDVACRMDFRKYPVDRQDCIVRLESFSYCKEDLVFYWLGEDRMTINPDIILSNYNYSVDTSDTYVTHYYKECFSGLILRIGLTRKMHVHIIQDFLPSFLYVWIAYFAVLLPTDIPAVRTALVLFPMLALTKLTNRIRTEIPVVSVLSFMDLWLICCLTFIFSSMINIVSTAVLIMYKKEVLWKKKEFWFKVFYPTTFTILIIVYFTALINA